MATDMGDVEGRQEEAHDPDHLNAARAVEVVSIGSHLPLPSENMGGGVTMLSPSREIQVVE